MPWSGFLYLYFPLPFLPRGQVREGLFFTIMSIKRLASNALRYCHNEVYNDSSCNYTYNKTVRVYKEIFIG